MEDREKERGREVSGAEPGGGRRERTSTGEGRPVFLLLLILNILAAPFRAHFPCTCAVHVSITPSYKVGFIPISQRRNQRGAQGQIISKKDCCLAINFPS